MKTKRSTLIGLLSTLLVIVTVLSSVLVFTATAGTTEPDPSPDIYTYASSVAELKEKDELTDWYLAEDSWDVWSEVDPNTSGRATGYYFIDLTELDYDTVAFAIASQNKNFLRYAFLTEMPENDGDLAKYAAGTTYNKMETSSSSWNKKLAGRLYFDDIPEDAKYLAVLGRYWSSDGYCPTSITFLRTDKNLLRNDLATYEYQINDILCASHVADGGSWAVKDAGKVTGSGLIPIAGTTFDSVSFTASSVGDTVKYNFLTGIPGNWDGMSGFTVDGSSDMKTAAAGEKIAIPAGAEYIVVDHTKQNTLKLPARITFFNSNATEDWLGIPVAPTTETVAYTGLEENGCVYGWDKDSNSHIWLEEYTSDYHSGFIDLTGRNYTKVSFTVGSEGYLGFGFLNETPVLGEKVSYAGGAIKFIEPGASADTTVEVNIPADATTIVVWMREGSDSYVPSSITLTYEEKAAAPYGIELGAVAEARLNANSGLRFTTRIPTAELAGLDYTVGTLIFPTDALDGALTVDTEDALNIEMTRGVVAGDYTYFSAAMTSIIAQNYAREFTAVSYIKVDGEYYYTAATSSSIYEAAVETYKANEEDANADAVRAYIDGVVVIEDGEQVMPYDGYEHALTATITDGTLTITGEAALATVIIDGVIYTGGWITTAGGYTATID